MASVKFQNICKDFGKLRIVKNLDLTINDGEFHILVGPSGCGKSTTLRMVAGLEEITSGEIFIEDKMVNNIAPKDRDISMVFQNYALYPHMNVYNNMSFGLKLRKFPKEEIDKRVQSAAKILNIDHLLQRKPKELSGGQRQRVAMGRAIVREPKVFLFDEPLSNLDAKLRVQMREEIHKLHNRLKTTTIYVTHDQVEAITLGDRITIMDEGIIKQSGSPLEIYNKPENLFVAGFIGSPAMNMVPCRLKEKENSLFLESKNLIIPLPERFKGYCSGNLGASYLLGVRPEDIVLGSEVDNPSPVVKCHIEIVEPMGAEIYIYSTLPDCAGENRSIFRVASDSNLKKEQNIEIFFNMNKVHLFNRDTGASAATQ